MGNATGIKSILTLIYLTMPPNIIIYSTLSSSACVFLSREMNLTHLSLSPKFKEDSAPSNLTHTLEEELDMNIDQMRQNYTVWIRRRFRAYVTPLVLIWTRS